MSELYDLVIECENQLGWTIPDGVEPWRARMVEVGRLKRVLQVRTDVSVKDLRTALAYCRRRREPITSPVQLFAKVNIAKELLVQPERNSELEIDHRHAILTEQMRSDRESPRWIEKLVRCAPAFRAEVLADWRAAGRA